MRSVSVALTLILLVVSLAGCCTPPPSGEDVAEVTPVPDVAEPAPPVEAQAPVSLTVDEAMATEGFVVCRRDEDVRFVEVQELKDGRCMLLYGNQQSGTGTQNILENIETCRLQQQRMKQNFVRAGFECE